MDLTHDSPPVTLKSGNLPLCSSKDVWKINLLIWGAEFKMCQVCSWTSPAVLPNIPLLCFPLPGGFSNNPIDCGIVSKKQSTLYKGHQVLRYFWVTWEQCKVYVVNNVIWTPYRFSGLYILEVIVLPTEFESSEYKVLRLNSDVFWKCVYVNAREKGTEIKTAEIMSEANRQILWLGHWRNAKWPSAKGSCELSNSSVR